MTLSPQYVVDWLNHWVSQGVPVDTLIDQRVVFDDSRLPPDAESRYSLVVAGWSGGGAALGILGVLSSLVDADGYRIAAHYIGDGSQRWLTHFELVSNATFKEPG